MYYVVSINDTSISYGSSVVIDTAVLLAKKHSKNYSFTLLVVDNEEGVVKGFADVGRFVWAQDCGLCDGLIKEPYSCARCNGYGALKTENTYV